MLLLPMLDERQKYPCNQLFCIMKLQFLYQKEKVELYLICLIKTSITVSDDSLQNITNLFSEQRIGVGGGCCCCCCCCLLLSLEEGRIVKVSHRQRQKQARFGYYALHAKVGLDLKGAVSQETYSFPSCFWVSLNSQIYLYYFIFYTPLWKVSFPKRFLKNLFGYQYLFALYMILQLIYIIY